MRPFKQPVFIGYGWGQDLQFEGHRPGDVVTVAFGRAGSTHRTRLAPLVVPPSGFVQVRVDGDLTREWLPTRYRWEMTYTRNGASGVLTGLPELDVRVPLDEMPEANDPLFGLNQLPLDVPIRLGQFPEIGVTLVVGLKGDPGSGTGANYDAMADLTLIFENGLI